MKSITSKIILKEFIIFLVLKFQVVVNDNENGSLIPVLLITYVSLQKNLDNLFQHVLNASICTL